MTSLHFKSVVTDKKNRSYGDVIEYTSEEKVPVALQLALTSYEPFQGKYLATPADVKINKLFESPLADKLGKKWANNQYEVTGTAKITKRPLNKNAILKPEQVTFVLKFKDKLSHIGLPELEVLSFELAV